MYLHKVISKKLRTLVLPMVKCARLPRTLFSSLSCPGSPLLLSSVIEREERQKGKVSADAAPSPAPLAADENW
jgi:hypothetical protein